MTAPASRTPSAGSTRPKPSPWGEGCGFLLVVCGVTCFFLAINSLLVASTYPVLAALGPTILRREKVAQVLVFALPVLMTVLQWWLVDLAARLFGRRR